MTVLLSPEQVSSRGYEVMFMGAIDGLERSA